MIWGKVQPSTMVNACWDTLPATIISSNDEAVAPDSDLVLAGFYQTVYTPDLAFKLQVERIIEPAPRRHLPGDSKQGHARLYGEIFRSIYFQRYVQLLLHILVEPPSGQDKKKSGNEYRNLHNTGAIHFSAINFSIIPRPASIPFKALLPIRFTGQTPITLLQ